MRAPELDQDGNYAFKNKRFGPTHPYWTYIDQPDSNFYSMHLSGSQRLPNGNTLICEGAKGKFTEINRDGQKVWQYVNPTKSNDNITNQGEVTTVNQVFRVERISKEHPALAEKELIHMGYLESGSDFTCELYDNQTSVDFDDIKDLFLNQSNDRIEIESKEIIRNIEIFNYIGVRILSIDSNTNIKSINTSNFGTGIYFLKIHSSNKAIHRKIMIN